MTLLRPPLGRPLGTESGPSPEVLFKEARRRRRRRWAVGAAVVILVASGAWLGDGASGNGGREPRPKATTPRPQGAAPPVPATRGPLPVLPHAAPSLRSIAFFNPTVGYGLFQLTRGGFCEVAVSETTDGGSTFAAPVPVAPCNRFDVSTSARLAFDDHGDGFLYGTSLFVTHDGGSSWQPDPQPGPVVSVEALGSSIWMLEATCAPPVSRTSPQRCPLRVYESTDGGGRWEQSPAQPPSASMTGRIGDWWGSLVRVSTTAAYVVGVPTTATAATGASAAGTVPLYFTADGGRSWVQRTIPCGPGAERAVVSAAPSGTLFAVCGWFTQVGGEQHKAVLVSTDGGATWARRATCPVFACPLSSGYLGVIDAVSPSVAYEIGYRGGLLETTDGGAVWSWSADRAPVGTGGPSDVIFFDPSDGVALSTGDLWHTTNAGQSWSETTAAVHQAPLPTRTGGSLAASTLPAPITTHARSIAARTSVRFEAPFVLPPSLSATATANRDRYSVSLFECPGLLRFDTPAIGRGSCAGTGHRFGSFGGTRAASAGAARRVVQEAVARPPGCPRSRKLVRQAARTGSVVQVEVAATGSLCALTWQDGRWALEIVGEITSGEVTILVDTPTEQLGHWSARPGSTGVLIVDKVAGRVQVLARWSSGSSVYDVRVPVAAVMPTLAGALPLISAMTPVSSG